MTACEVCGETHSIPCFTKNGYQIVRCPNCRLMYVSNPPSMKELEDIYSRRFFEGLPSLFSYVEYKRQEKVAALNAMRRWKVIGRYINGGRVLDIGCAFGSFLNAVPPGWERYGIEISPYAAQKGQEKYGLDIFQGDFSEYDNKGRRFDLVTLWDTIEHLHNPSDTIKKAAQILEPKGYLMLSTGDVESFCAKILGRRWYLFIPPTHLFFFSVSTISILLRHHGFETIQISHTGKYVPIKDLVRGLYLLFQKTSCKFMNRLAQSSIGNISVYFNFFDIMTVIARKRPGRR